MKTLLDGLRDSAMNEPGRQAIDVFHVNSRFSEEFEDIGRFSSKKATRLLKYCCQALRFRWQFGVTHFYYVPAPPQRTPLYRDWVVMLFCRPFFRTFIFHWHACGLGEWMETKARPWERWLTRMLLGNPDLSIVLGEPGRADAIRLKSKASVIVPNGIADPCPEFAAEVQPHQLARRAVRQKLLDAKPLSPANGGLDVSNGQQFHVLFLALCSREKGLFDCLDGIALLIQRLSRENSPMQVVLKVAGSFRSPAEQAEFEQAVRGHGLPFVTRSDLAPAQGGFVQFCGFASGNEKIELFKRCDAFCFPTFYSAESFPLVLLEAMAFDLPIVTTRWRSIPEMLPEAYPGLVDPHAPQAISVALETALRAKTSPGLRSRFLERFTQAHYIRNMKNALIKLLSAR